MNKSAAFRAAFANFDIDTVAAFTDADVARLLTNDAIVSNVEGMPRGAET